MIILIPLSARGRARLLRVLGWGMCAGALMFAAFAIGTWNKDNALAHRGVTSNAVVTKSDYEPGGTSSITVRFADRSGVPHDESIDVANTPQAAGMIVAVEYDPTDPSTLRLAGDEAAQNMGAWEWAGIAALFLLISIACFGVRRFSNRVSKRRPGGLLGSDGTRKLKGAIQ